MIGFKAHIEESFMDSSVKLIVNAPAFSVGVGSGYSAMHHLGVAGQKGSMKAQIVALISKELDKAIDDAFVAAGMSTPKVTIKPTFTGTFNWSTPETFSYSAAFAYKNAIPGSYPIGYFPKPQETVAQDPDEQPPADSTLEDLHGSRSTYAHEVLPQLVPDLNKQTGCPACAVGMIVRSQVIHLNDVHEWKYEQIAQWLDDLEATGEFDFTIVEPETNKEEDK